MFILALFLGLVYIFLVREVYKPPTTKSKSAKLASKAEPEKNENILAKQKAETEAKLAEAKRAEQKEFEDRLAKAKKKREEARAAFDEMVKSIHSVPAVISQVSARKLAASHIDDLTFSTITVKSDMNKLGNFVAIDTETTGLKYTKDEIIDIAAIRFRDFQPIEKFSMFVMPHIPIPAEASAINHITDDMVKGQPFFQQIAESLLEFIGSDNIVGHNLPFDLKFIVRYGANVTGEKRKYYDTLAIARKTIKKQDGISDYKLGTLCTYLDIIQQYTHRAESDALSAGLLFHELAEMRVHNYR